MRFGARGGGLWWQLVALVAVIMGAFSVGAARG